MDKSTIANKVRTRAEAHATAIVSVALRLTFDAAAIAARIAWRATQAAALSRQAGRP